jgi:hypothetical protein
MIMKKELIAPCGMNCGICMAYLREKNKCPGCRAADTSKPVTRVRCKIKACEVFQKGRTKFCFECEQFPCGTLRHLDKRYRTKYKMSMIDNLLYIKEFGTRRFLKNEDSRWTCSQCAGTICVHKGSCIDCGRSMARVF